MAICKIVLYAENKAILREKSRPIKSMTRQVRRIVEDLQDTLNHHASGIGLAAPQIGIHRRVVVVRLGCGKEDGEPGPPEALINPEILEAGDEKKDFDGCLSFPGLYGETVRPHRLKVRGWDANGQAFERVFEGFDAVVVHHEIDHLDGVLFIDRIESIDDLYQVYVDRDGRLVRLPLTVTSRQGGLD